MDRRPVVLVVIKGLGLGGAERLIAEAVAFWNRERYDYRVAYFLPWKDQLVGEIVDQAVSVSLIGKGRLGIGAALGLRRLIKESGADLVHVHSPAAGILARLVSSVPVIYTEHNLADSYRQPTRILNRLTYRRNTRVIAVSEAVAESVSAFGGLAPEVIENGVSCDVTVEASEAARHSLNLEPGRPLVVHVGNIRPYKGHRTLLAAARRFAGNQPAPLIVSIGGEKFPGDLQRLQSEATKAGLDDVIVFLGRRDDARAFLATADVVVNPSDVEGLPVVVLEAMALRRAIVATSVGGVPDLIKDHETGLLVPPGDPDALANAIVLLLDDPQLAGSLGSRAEIAVTRDHGMEKMVRAVESAYEEVLGG